MDGTEKGHYSIKDRLANKLFHTTTTTTTNLRACIGFSLCHLGSHEYSTSTPVYLARLFSIFHSYITFFSRHFAM